MKITRWCWALSLGGVLALELLSASGCGTDTASPSGASSPREAGPAPGNAGPGAAKPTGTASSAAPVELRADARTSEAPARSPEVARPVAVASADNSYPSNLYVERDVKVAARTSGVLHKVLVDRGAS